MKAFLCKEFGPVDSHTVEEIEDPVAGPGQVVVDIKATGISFPDVLFICTRLMHFLKSGYVALTNVSSVSISISTCSSTSIFATLAVNSVWSMRSI